VEQGDEVYQDKSGDNRQGDLDRFDAAVHAEKLPPNGSKKNRQML